MTPVVLDDLNVGDKIRVICKPDADGIAEAVDGEFRGWDVSKRCRAITVVWRWPFPGKMGIVTSVIRTGNIDKILRMGR